MYFFHTVLVTFAWMYSYKIRQWSADFCCRKFPQILQKSELCPQMITFAVGIIILYVLHAQMGRQRKFIHLSYLSVTQKMVWVPKGFADNPFSFMYFRYNFFVKTRLNF